MVNPEMLMGMSADQLTDQLALFCKKHHFKPACAEILQLTLIGMTVLRTDPRWVWLEAFLEAWYALD